MRVHILTIKEPDESPMRYTLKTLSLIDPPIYKALSYTWGNTHSKKSLILNGATCLVTKNLDIALRHLQHEDSPEPLWVDSLCINQEVSDVGDVGTVRDRECCSSLN